MQACGDPLNALTVDVEDYYQVTAFERVVRREDWGQYPSRVVANTHRVLDLLARHGVRGTFFTLGWIAQRWPELVREIAAAGHEIGTHSYWHRMIHDLSPAEFREDLRRSIGVLEGILSTQVTLHRAPSFSVTKRSLWALDILVEEGIRVDSSIFPVHHDRYGMPDAPLEIHRIDTPAGALWEFPPSVARVGGMRLPVAGGGYFRMFPLSWTTALLRRIHHFDRRPFLVYFHPWEIDPGQPRIAVRSWLSRFRHYVHLAGTEAKLASLFQQFRFAPLGEVVDTVMNRTHHALS